MKWPKKIGWKLYFILFSLMSMGSLTTMLFPESEVFMYYHTLMTLHRASGQLYLFALAAWLLTIISLWTLFAYAFHQQPRAIGFFRAAFILRILADFAGHNFEYLCLKSTFLAQTSAGIAMVALLAVFLLPSYVAHFRYAFRGKRKPKQLSFLPLNK